MRILTWNINGIRASKLKLDVLLKQLDADIICFQETKVTSKIYKFTYYRSLHLRRFLRV